MDGDFDSVVIGAGVVGLAVARALARAGASVLVLEAAERIGEGVSSRNSGVIHAGLPYPPGSLKARLCVRGRELLYRYCAARGVGHQRCGKWIVAVEEAELPALRALQARAAENGVPVRWLDAKALTAREAALRAVAALDSPESGIVDVPELLLALRADLEALGGVVLCRTEVAGIARESGCWRVEARGDGAVRTRRVVNAAGLGALALARATAGVPAATLPQAWYGRGHYYALRGRSPFSRLIYPLPAADHLGVHLVLDLAGRCRFGPDLDFVDAPDYRFDGRRRATFAAAIRRWWPELPEADLVPDFVGVRPKIAGPGRSADFRIDDASVHGQPGLVQLFGIESPGLTAALAIGEEVAGRLGR